MSERSRSTQRIVSVQRKIRDLAEWKLALTERLRNEASTARSALDAFIDGANLTGSLSMLAVNETRRLSAREAEFERRRVALSEATVMAKSRLKLAEQMAEGIADEERQADDRRLLEQLIEGLVSRAGSDAEPG